MRVPGASNVADIESLDIDVLDLLSGHFVSQSHRKRMDIGLRCAVRDQIRNTQDTTRAAEIDYQRALVLPENRDQVFCEMSPKPRVDVDRDIDIYVRIFLQRDVLL